MVWIHGGAFLFGSRLYGPGTGPACRALIERCVAVGLVQYRFSGEALFPVKAAVRWLRRLGEHVGVNGDAIGVWGVSSGGHLAAFTDLNSNDERLDGSHPGVAPLLLVHGLEDALLPPQQSALMHDALKAVGAPSELEWVEGAGHVLFGVDPDPIADRSADFLARHLM